MTPPLAGIRVLSLTHAWAGPICTQLLGVMGAEVIIVETRRRPDNSRGGYEGAIQPVVAARPTAQHPWNCASSFNAVNLNKQSLSLDLQTAEGLELFRRLVPLADVVVDNYSPRVLHNLGIDYPALRAIKPDIILCSISAYGHSGPYENFPGIGGTIEATSGMSSLFGYPDGPPMNSSVDIPDSITALYAYGAIVSALHHRAMTGEGQYLDVSMQEATATTIGDAVNEATSTGRTRPRIGNRHPAQAPHGMFPAAGDDAWVAIAAEDDPQWRALCTAAGHEDWATDPRFATMAARLDHVDDLERTVLDWTRHLDRDEIVDRLLAAGVIVARVLNGADVVEDETYRRRGFVASITHPETGDFWQVTSPFRLTRTPPAAAFHAPLQGEHSEVLLRDLLGVPHEVYERLVAANVSGGGPPQ